MSLAKPSGGGQPGVTTWAITFTSFSNAVLLLHNLDLLVLTGPKA